MPTATPARADRYRVPTMAEVAAIPHNGLTVASTFSGCGGSSLGYRMAGAKVVWASEFIPAAQDTYRTNNPATILDTRDIRTVQPQEVLDAAGLDAGQLDILDGSPPCSSFSTAGARQRLWGKAKAYSDSHQRTDDLFMELLRLVEGIRPRAVVAENVAGLAKGLARGYLTEILGRLRSIGYRAQCALVNAQSCGVPQSSERTIFIAIRSDLGVGPRHPRPLRQLVTLGDAIADLGDDPDRLSKDNDIRPYAIGREWIRMGAAGTKSSRYFQLVRPRLDRPCPTITQTAGMVGAAGVVHPTEPRKFTLRELRRICSFPDDFALTGTFAQQYERLGRAVPPLMMKRIAEAVRDTLWEAR